MSLPVNTSTRDSIGIVIASNLLPKVFSYKVLYLYKLGSIESGMAGMDSYYAGGFPTCEAGFAKPRNTWIREYESLLIIVSSPPRCFPNIRVVGSLF
jgi:hypothetical protein